MLFLLFVLFLDLAIYLCLFFALWEPAMSYIQSTPLVRWAPRPSCTSAPSGELLQAAAPAADDQSTPPSPAAARCRRSDQPSATPDPQAHSRNPCHHVPEVHQHPVWRLPRRHPWRHGPNRLRWEGGWRRVDLGELPGWVTPFLSTPTHTWTTKNKWCNIIWMLHISYKSLTFEHCCSCTTPCNYRQLLVVLSVACRLMCISSPMYNAGEILSVLLYNSCLGWDTRK